MNKKLQAKWIQSLHDSSWDTVRSLLPEDLDQTARDMNALRRRREVPNAEALVRIILAYVVSGLSIKDVAAWAAASGIAELTGEGIFYRLVVSEQWLRHLLCQVLLANIVAASGNALCEKLRLRVADATVIVGPKAKGTEWRVHTLIDPRSANICTLELTDEHVGEGFARFPVEPGDVLMGDCIYSAARSVYSVHDRGGYAIARFSPASLRLCNPQRERVPVSQWESGIPQAGVVSWDLRLPIPPQDENGKAKAGWKLANAAGWIPVRVLAARTPKGTIIWIISTLPVDLATPEQLLELYRIRWQIELVFKRLKSLMDLDELRSRHQGPTAKSWILGKLLAAALAQRMLTPDEDSSPGDIPSKWDEHQPSLWSEFRMAFLALQRLVLGIGALSAIRIQEYRIRLRASPRKRLPQHMPAWCDALF